MVRGPNPVRPPTRPCPSWSADRGTIAMVPTALPAAVEFTCPRVFWARRVRNGTARDAQRERLSTVRIEALLPSQRCPPPRRFGTLEIFASGVGANSKIVSKCRPRRAANSSCDSQSIARAGTARPVWRAANIIGQAPSPPRCTTRKRASCSSASVKSG